MNEFSKFLTASLNNSIVTDGFWKHRTDNYMDIINSMLDALLCPTNSARLLNFGIMAGELSGSFDGSNWSDGDCYKFLEGCCYIYQNTKDDEVLKIINTYIPWIVKSQQDDGYINTQITLTDKQRWEKPMHHELYNQGHLMTFAAAHYEATGDRRVLDCAIKLCDYLYDVFSGYPKELAHFGANPSNIMGLCDIYRITKNEKYWKLAEVFVNMRGSGENGKDQNQDRTPLREETKAVGHAVTSTYLYSGAADVYAQSGEAKLLDALKAIWDDMTGKRSYITGASSPAFVGYSENGDLTHEAHDSEYNLPNKVAYNESCANIGSAMWAMRMLSVTEDTKYGDWAELIMYNSGISGTSLDLTKYFYSNPLSYRKDTPIAENYMQYKHKSSRRWHTFTCWCCPPQIFRTISGIGRWIYGISDKCVYVNMFADCDFNKDGLSLSMKTNYPWDGNITIDVKEASSMSIKIRIPAWCKAPTVNGAKATPGTYFELPIKSGDTINVDLPMQAVVMQSNPNIESDRGMICIKRGPIVYCAEGCDNEAKLDDIYMDPHAEYKCTYDEELLGGIVKISAEAFKKQEHNELYYEYVDAAEKTTLNLIPYYAWANRQECDMSIWFPHI